MKKVYVVYGMWYEDYGNSDIRNTDTVDKIFNSKEKAVAHIMNAFKELHDWANGVFPNDKCVTLYDPSSYYIQEGVSVRVLDRWVNDKFSLAIHYRYGSYDVE
jgi:hypothetical protein